MIAKPEKTSLVAPHKYNAIITSVSDNLHEKLNQMIFGITFSRKLVLVKIHTSNQTDFRHLGIMIHKINDCQT